jgi:hypothetical protein
MSEPRYTSSHQRLRHYAEAYLEDEARYPELNIPIEHVKAVIYAFLEDMDNREMREAGEDLAAFGLPQALDCAKQKEPWQRFAGKWAISTEQWLFMGNLRRRPPANGMLAENCSFRPLFEAGQNPFKINSGYVCQCAGFLASLTSGPFSGESLPWFKLYDRTSDVVSLDEVERVVF